MASSTASSDRGLVARRRRSFVPGQITVRDGRVPGL